MGVSYTYSSDGTRLTKTVNGVKTSYTWDGAQLVSQTTTGGDTLYFIYHGDSRVAVEYKGNTYYYIYNLQGDVVGLVKSSGTSVVSYTYDAWGNPESISGSMASTLGAANPFRYRSYYFDTESGLYYLMSRYYDPVVGRFLNADYALGVNQDSATYNLYVYCGNNPITRMDIKGLFWEEIGDFFTSVGNGIVEGVKAVGNFVANSVKNYARDYSYEVIEHNMNAAKDKYNESTVGINGLNPDAPVQVTIDPKHPDRLDSTKTNPNITIEDSYKVKSKYEMEAILTVVKNSPEFDADVFTRSMNSYISEWKGHNALYTLDVFGIIRSRTGGVDLNENPYPEDFIWVLW